MGYGYYPRYVSVAEKKARAEKKIKQLKKKNPDIQPIIPSGKALATTWWGKAWNKNLERYADYTNRIGRGRSYVRHGAVVDLNIVPGCVEALVQGTRGAPYKVRITIGKIKARNWGVIKKKCLLELSSLPDLLAGKFPGKLQDLFMVQGKGLFPSPGEISFDCSCPDWASMCKHVAATLYGVGVRLDEDPSLFFTLRQVAMEDLVHEAVQEKAEAIIGEKATGKRVIADDALSDLFGLDIDVTIPSPQQKKKIKRKQKNAKKVGKEKGSQVAAKQKKAKKQKKATGKKTNRRRAVTSQEPKLPKGYGTATALVRGCIEGGGDEGFSVQDLADITGIPAAKLYPILQKLRMKGCIHRLRRGVYGADN